MSQVLDEDGPDVVEHFFGVYLLYCTNPKYKGRTYIGYTVNPNRRIKQHNAGKNHGGAWKTSNRGPWNMILIVHGFFNSTAALRFEWAWQHPHRSRRLKHVPKKRAQQKKLDFCLMVLTEMLNVGPWNRLPLTLRWLDNDFASQYSASISPPLHMPICHGKVTPRKLNVRNSQEDVMDLAMSELSQDVFSVICNLCGFIVEDKEKITCLTPTCLLVAHLICLAEKFRRDNMLLPIDGNCPTCNTNVLWGDLIRKKIGCYQNI